MGMYAKEKLRRVWRQLVERFGKYSIGTWSVATEWYGGSAGACLGIEIFCADGV